MSELDSFKVPERKIKRTLVVVLFLLWTCQVYQLSLVYAQRWLTHQYSEGNGPVSSNVCGITQDQYGRIWMATRAGISCYDGISWEHYTDFEGLAAPSFVYIEVDRQGQVWALAEPYIPGETQIFVFDGEKWHSTASLDIDIENKNDVTAFKLLETDDKTIALVGTLDTGLYCWTGTDGKWTNLSEKDGLAANKVNGIAVMNGQCYLASDNGLSLVHADHTIDKNFGRHLGFPVKKVDSIAVEDKDRYPDSFLHHSRMWIFGGSYLGYFDENSEKTVYFDTGIQFQQTDYKIRLLPDHRMGVYIGNVFNLFYFAYDTNQTQRLKIANGLISEGVNAMFCDFEKLPWICCDRGVTKISSRRFSSFQQKDGLLEDEVTAILEYQPGKFALGHNNGITLYDGKLFTPVPFGRGSQSGTIQGRVLDMKLDTRNNIWAAASSLGLARLDAQGQLTWYGSGQGLPGSVVSLWIDRVDNKWICTDKGIFLLNNNGVITNRSNEFPTTRVRKIFGSDKKDRLVYLATYINGLYSFENNRWRNYRLQDLAAPNTGKNRKDDSIYAVKEDSMGRLFVGTAGGIFTRESGNLRRFTVKGFNLERPVYFIVEDNLHRFWFGTDNGVVLWDWDNNRETVYSVTEGLIGQETNRAAGIVDHSGQLWFGTNRGVSIYDRQFDNLDSWNPPPRLQLLYLETYRAKMPLDQPIQLSYNDRRILFKFRGISFQDEKGIRFKYQLEGFDDTGWVEANYLYRQVIEYTSLRPGTYRFHLMACNAMGIWSDAVSSRDIIILKPFYQTWWFFLVVILAAALILYSIFHFISARRNTARLEKLVFDSSNQLVASEKKYRELFEDSQDMVFIMSLGSADNEKGVNTMSAFVDINPAGVELLGCKSKNEAMAINIDNDFFFNPAEGKLFTREIRQKRSVKDYELDIKRKEGERMTALLTASLVPGGKNEPAVVRGIIRNITDKKRLQQQLEQSHKMEAIGTLAGGIAHDFNNILGMIKGYLELCLNDAVVPADSKVRKNIERAIVSSDRAKELVKQILTFSRQRTEERIPLKIGMVIEETMKLLRSSLPTTVQFRMDIRSGATVMADPTQVHQVVVNLCTNAAYAMREKGGFLGVLLHDITIDQAAAADYDNIRPGQYVLLTVSDTGQGIEPAIIKRIFEPYFTTKEKGEGTGMGLAVIHGIVKSYGGDIKVTSQPGKGSVFYVLFPAEKAIGEPPKPLPPAEVPQGKNEKVLLVDDEPLLVDVGKMALEMLGYEVTDATDSEEALLAFKKNPGKFDLVITDLTMPKMTGMQLSAELKKIRDDIPIILCTGFSEKVSREQLDNLGIKELLLKPLDKRSLASAMRRVLQK